MFSADGAEPKCTIVADVTLTPWLTSWFDPAYVIRSALRFHHVCRIAARKKFSFRFFLSVFFHRATICLFGRSQRVVFTARCYASAVLAMGLCLSVRVRVCPSVTSRSSTETAKRRITQTTSHDTPGTGFLTPKISAKFDRGHPLRGRQIQVGWASDVRQITGYISNTVKDRHIVSIKVEYMRSIEW